MRKFILLMFLVSGLFAQSKSVHLNGGTDSAEYIWEYNDPTWVTGDEWTMEAWINADDFSSAWGENHLFRLGGQIYVKADGTLSMNGGTGAGGTGSTVLVAGTWYHIAYVRTATSTVVYLNGVEEINTAAADGGSATMLYLGVYNSSYPDSHFSGMIDEFRLWNDVRTETEIQSNMNNELVGNEADLLIYYNFNGGSGSTVADVAGGDDDGTLENTEAGDWVTDTAPVPVELTSFTASAVDGSVLLNWETATEVNNYGFDVESSVDGESFAVVGFVEGHGNSNTPQSYSFTATDGAKYYRLKQLDSDSGFEYSEVVEVEGSLVYKLSQNYPNPFNPTTEVSFTLPQAIRANISIYNTLGQKVMEVADREFTAGNHSVVVNASQLTSGMYFYKLETSNFSKTMKMLLLK